MRRTYWGIGLVTTLLGCASTSADTDIQPDPTGEDLKDAEPRDGEKKDAASKDTGGKETSGGKDTGTGEVAPPNCIAGKRKCVDKTPQVCTEDGEWEDQTACPVICSAGECTGKCTSGDKQCNDTVPQTCGDDGEWEDGTACKFACNDGGCSGVCVPGSRRCSEDSLGTETCDDKGEWQSGITCSGLTPTCENGDCVASKPTSFTAGGLHTCVIMPDVAPQCWGDNDYGQLGNGLKVDSVAPVEIVGLDSGAVLIAGGGYHTCLLNASGGVQCWGQNTKGQLGNNNTSNSYVPVDVSGLAFDVSMIDSGMTHSCAATSEALLCWGNNQYGQLGNHSTSPSPSPVKVSGFGGGAKAIAAGTDHTCALTKEGGVKCWGRNSEGQLGNGSKTDSNVPVEVSGLASGVKALGGGTSHTCAIMSTGGLKCWGSNSSRKLGLEGVLSSLTPADVPGIANVVAVGGGSTHSCALTVTGAVYCWGGNSRGELGQGTTNASGNPMVQITGITGSRLAVGEAHNCVLTTSGGIKCWGYNNGGQCGNTKSSGSYESRPVDVKGFGGT